MKTWTKPSFREIAMNAEIGSYQPDWDADRPTEAKPEPAPAHPSLGEAGSTVVSPPAA